ERRHPGAAVLLGELDAEQPERGQLRHQLDRKVLLLVPLAHVGTHLGLRELADAPAQQFLFFGQSEVHAAFQNSTAPAILTTICRRSAPRASRRRPRCRRSDAYRSRPTSTTFSVNWRRPDFSRNAIRAPSSDHAGRVAPLTRATVCLCFC